MSNEFFEKPKLPNEEKIAAITEDVERILKKGTLSSDELGNSISVMHSVNRFFEKPKLFNAEKTVTITEEVERILEKGTLSSDELVDFLSTMRSVLGRPTNGQDTPNF